MARHPASRFARSFLGLSAIGLIASGCAAKPPTPVAPVVATVKPMLRIENLGAPPTEAEILEFADGLIASVERKDAAACRSFVDWDAIVEQATSRTPELPVLAGVRATLVGSFDKPSGFFTSLHALADGGAITLLRIRERGGEPSALIRVLPADGGAAYHEYRVARRPDGKVRAVDVYDYLEGDRLVDRLHRVTLPVIADRSGGSLPRPSGEDEAIVKALPRLGEMSTAVREGRPRDALAIYEGLTAEGRQSKPMLMARFKAAKATGDDSLQITAIRAIQDRYPDEAWTDMLAIDGCVIRKDHAGLEACLLRLDRALGGDPYLVAMRASSLLELGRLDEARDLARAATEAEPDLTYAQIVRAQVALRRGDAREALDRFRLLRDDFETTLEEFSECKGYEAFTKTPEYATFREETDKLQPPAKPDEPTAKPTPPDSPKPAPGR